MQTLDSRNAYSRSGNNLIQRDSRSDHSCNFFYLNLIILKSGGDACIIDGKFLLAYLVLSICIILQEVQGRKFKFLQLFPIIDTRKLLCYLLRKMLTLNNFKFRE